MVELLLNKEVWSWMVTAHCHLILAALDQRPVEGSAGDTQWGAWPGVLQTRAQESERG